MADEPFQNVTFPSNGDEAHGYLAVPDDGAGPGVIVIQEWWGLVTHIKEVTDRFAGAGFTALAPDLFGGSTTHDADEANRLMSELPVDQAARDLSGAVDFLLDHEATTSESVGAVGFCMGGGFVLVLAALEGGKIGAAVPYYGVGGYDQVDITDITAPVLGHYGTDDDMNPVDDVRDLEQTLRDAGVEVDIRIYDGAGHAFFNDTNAMGTYDAELAASTWDDTTSFLRQHLA